MKKTKILFVLAQMLGGGAERVTINIIRILDRELFDIHLVVMSREGPSYEYLPDDITLHDLNVTKTMFSIFKLRNSILNIKPDIIYSTLFRTHQALYFALQGINDTPIVLMRSQNSPKLLLENNSLGYFSKFLLEKAYAKADFVLAQTPEMKNEIVKYHNINEEKIKVFLNPLDTDNIDEKIKNVETPFDKNCINVVAAGRLTKQKGFDVLIKSFKDVVETNREFVLHIIGEDLGEKEKLIEMTQKFSLVNNIKFLGYQKNPYKYFFFSDLFVLSSRWEGLPNAVLENLYLKKPVVATKCIPFMEQLIQENKNGKLVDVEDHIQLADAILNYKEIKMEFLNPKGTKKDLNDLFQSIYKLK